MNIKDLYSIYKDFPIVETDSRNVKPNSIFFALKGPNFNGEDYVYECLNKGVKYCIVSPNFIDDSPNIIKVEDTLICLQELANYHRKQFNIPFIAITGSNGKTTTKELVALVLSKKFKVHFTLGNLNNHIGIPLTILKIPLNCEIAIIEMGANHRNEISNYCRIVEPNYGLITNCGKAHLAGFGGIEGVRKGKGELYEYLSKNNGTAFINCQQDYLIEMAKNIVNKIYYQHLDKEVYIEELETTPFLILKAQINKKIYKISTHLVGTYNVDNYATALTLGLFFKVELNKIIFALSEYQPKNKRSQFVQWKTNLVFLDAYNANPSSMTLALENFIKYPHPKKIILLGSMKELGLAAYPEHLKIINLIKTYNFFWVALVGQEFEFAQTQYSYFENVEDLKIYLSKHSIDNALVFIKGSRCTKMDLILDL